MTTLLLDIVIVALFQVLFCSKAKRIIVRLIPAILSFVTMVVFFALVFVSEDRGSGLACLTVAFLALINLVVCGLSGGICAIIKFIRRKKQGGDPTE